MIVDPVMIATSGARLLRTSAVRAMLRLMIPMADLVTPNLDEAEVLLGWKIDSEEGVRAAAREIHDQFGCAALVKGGHLKKAKDAVDFYYDGSKELMLSAPFVRGVSTHGTGCTYSAAIAGYLALGLALPESVELAKNHITQTIAQSVRIAKHTALNPLWA